MQLSIYTQFVLKKSTKNFFVGLHTRYKMQKQTRNILSQRTLSERDSMVPFVLVQAKLVVLDRSLQCLAELCRACAKAASPSLAGAGSFPVVAACDTEHQNVWHDHVELANLNPSSEG